MCLKDSVCRRSIYVHAVLARVLLDLCRWVRRLGSRRHEDLALQMMTGLRCERAADCWSKCMQLEQVHDCRDVQNAEAYIHLAEELTA